MSIYRSFFFFFFLFFVVVVVVVLGGMGCSCLSFKQLNINTFPYFFLKKCLKFIPMEVVALKKNHTQHCSDCFLLVLLHHIFGIIIFH